MKIAHPYKVRYLKDAVEFMITRIDTILKYSLRNKESNRKNKGYYGQKTVRDDLEMAKFYLQNIIGKKNNTPHINKMIPPKTTKSIRMGWYEFGIPDVKGE